MDLQLDKMPWYGQVAAFAGLALVGAGVFWYVYALPAGERISERQAQLAAVRAEIDKGLETSERLPEFRAQVAQLEAQLEQLRTVLPEEKDVGDLLRRIQGMATQSSLTIRGFTPNAIITRQMHAEWPIGLVLEGTYHNLGLFLERVSKFPRIINVGELAIFTKDPQSPGATITAECTATTFVMTEDEPAAVATGRE